MTSTVFMIGADNALTALSQTAYDSEDLFQRLLADHPALLGDVAGPSRRLLLVQREAPVPEALDGSGRWSLDHLFLDQDGVPVLVEVKRATDTRSRREVVAQMLDYAANGVAYWPIEQMIEAVKAGSGSEETDSAWLGFLEGREPESFWRQVEANLRSGRIRMVFVADHIQKELRRIIEFLNEQMRPAEVLAIEVEQYTTPAGVRLLTPRLVGQTERAASAKAVGQSPQETLSTEAWLASLSERHGDAAQDIARKIVVWMERQGLNPSVSKSNDSLAVWLQLPDGKRSWPFFIRRSTGRLETALIYLRSARAFADEASRQAILDRLRVLPGVVINTTKTTGWPSVSLADLARPDVFAGWTEIATDICRALAASPPSQPSE